MPSFTYSNGLLITTPQVVAIFATPTNAGLPGWKDPYRPGSLLSDVCQITEFLDDVLDSAYMDLIAFEYSQPNLQIGRGKLMATSFIDVTSSNQAEPNEISDSDLQAMLRDQIQSGRIPPPSQNVCYFVFLAPSAVSVSANGRSDRQVGNSLPYNGYHSSFLSPSGQRIVYALIAYQSMAPTITISHELAELVTDPTGYGWTTDPDQTGKRPEIADVCEFSTSQLPASFHGNWVAKFSSRSGNKCLAPPDDGLAQRDVAQIRGGVTCLGHAIEAQPLELSLRVTRNGVPQPISQYTWNVADPGQASGPNDQPGFIVLPPKAPAIFGVDVYAISPLGCAFQVHRDIVTVTAADADREERLCRLLAAIRIDAIHVFRPDPLWDPLRDLVTRPPQRGELTTAARFALQILDLVAHLGLTDHTTHSK